MKRSLLIAFIFYCSFSLGQVAPQITGAGAPTNPCFNGGQQYLDTTNHVFYNCPANGSNWALIGLGNVAGGASNPVLSGAIVSSDGVSYLTLAAALANGQCSTQKGCTVYDNLPETWSTNPLPTSKGVTVYLSKGATAANSTWYTNAPLILVPGDDLIGLGTPITSLDNTTGTQIQPGPSFPSGLGAPTVTYTPSASGGSLATATYYLCATYRNNLQTYSTSKMPGQSNCPITSVAITGASESGNTVTLTGTFSTANFSSANGGSYIIVRGVGASANCSGYNGGWNLTGVVNNTSVTFTSPYSGLSAGCTLTTAFADVYDTPVAVTGPTGSIAVNVAASAGTAPFNSLGYTIYAGTASGLMTEQIQPVSTFNPACTAATIDASYTCAINSSATIQSIDTSRTTYAPVVDLTAPLVVISGNGDPGSAVNFGAVIRNISLQCQNSQGGGTPTEAVWFQTGQEQAILDLLQLAAAQTTGSACTQAWLYDGPYAPNSSMTHMYIGGGSYTGNAPLYGAIFDFRANSTGQPSGTFPGASRSLLDFTVAKSSSAATNLQAAIWVLGSAGTSDFSINDVHMEPKANFDGLRLSENADADVHNVNSNSGPTVHVFNNVSTAYLRRVGSMKGGPNIVPVQDDVRGKLGTSGQVPVDWDTGTAVVPLLNLNTQLNGKRYNTGFGSSLVTGDFGALSAGCGSTAALSAPTGNDSAFGFTITGGGTGQTANGCQVTLTFHDGTWTTIPKFQCSVDPSGTMTGIAGMFVNNHTTATTLQVTIGGTLAASGTILIQCNGMGI